MYVTDASGERIKGRLGELRPGSLVLMQGSRKIQMTEADVNRIQRGDSLQNGLWLGLGAGVAAAWIAPHLFCDLPDDECAAIVFAAIGLPSIAAGGVTGALVDAAIKKTIFQFAGTRASARDPGIARSRRPAGWSARDDSVLTLLASAEDPLLPCRPTEALATPMSHRNDADAKEFFIKIQ